MSNGKNGEPREKWKILMFLQRNGQKTIILYVTIRES